MQRGDLTSAEKEMNKIVNAPELTIERKYHLLNLSFSGVLI